MNYAEIATDTAEAIKEAGAPITLSRIPTGDYDQATSEAQEQPPKTYRGAAVQGRYTPNEIDGTLIQSGDARFLIAVGEIPRPQRDDVLTFAGERFRVIECTPLQPGGVPVLWDVQARR